MYNAKYHEENEELDDELFQQFVSDTKIFTDYKRNEKYSSIDYSATDIKGRRCAVELKRRFNKMYDFPTVFLENEKGWLMYNRWLQFGLIPLYLVFYDDGMLMFDLRKIKHPETEFVYRKVTIINKGYNEYQQVYRIELPLSIAIVFRKKNGCWSLES